ncbi:MAG TPA: NUDIX hydrolase [Pyrinomonadaceae bacterium]|nr:NUDIX hydrolase [Pyrinomonadaceae bacterium]
MLKDLLGNIWRSAPKAVRRLTTRYTQTRFTVTAAGIIVDEHSRVLLLKHRFRSGGGWGIPGGFIESGEQPEEALRRELREEVGLEVEDVQLFSTRTFITVKQLEILFRGRAKGGALPQSIEISKAGWFSLEELPVELPQGQQHLIRAALQDGAK